MVTSSMTDLRDLARSWQGVLGRLELEVSTHNFNTWLRGTRPLRLDGDTLVVEARTAFNCDWLNQRLSVVVRRAMGHVFPQDTGVLFVPKGADDCPEGRAAPEQPESDHQRRGPIIGSLNSHYTVDRYLPTEGNRLALDCCRSLLSDGDVRISPVLIYGTPGMGKTHLLHAVAFKAAADGWAVACLSAEEFTTRYQGALRRGAVEEFQVALRSVRMLVLDDLQYIAGKKATQDELVHTIDAVANAGGVVMVASERHPFELELADRLASRLAAGIVTRVEPFEASERRLYIERLARELRVALPGWALERLASIEAPSVRLLQGAVHAAVALQRMGSLELRRLDAELMRICVGETSRAGTSNLTLDAVARYFELAVEELAGRSRQAKATEARAVAAAALQAQGRSLRQIGAVLGGRDASTIKQLTARGKAVLDGDAELRTRVLKAIA